ncbi:DUF885 domain-containing protein [Luteimonas fraxinea]|uniref:DUF885 domain-containing protein n=1 Tax=Luteimonas fraxinea TaxID=2901869 RepID=A0ABS8U6V4_9GAMM|nr:DUF885 domain-containing protein [Luteimonas fraxinea]MCD9095460.1 DUF885 domain-containing protein [Luteimonas fraxinea]MCD9126299.1 DUF885 domain-containing protein [Luteimonas fraxinea]UHH11334.1 DUF885 domain-containing protein [Luteimonas fraxinea]
MKPLVLAIALSLAAPLTALAHTDDAKAAVAASQTASPAWVTRSNELSQILIDAQAPFQPEFAGFFGVPGYDDQVADFGPDNAARYRASLAGARTKLQTQLELERDANVRQDLQILLTSIDQSIEGSTLNEKYLLPWSDAPQQIFGGINDLLSAQTPPERRAKAIDRLKRYTGLTEGSPPITELARARYEERLSNPELLQPAKLEVQRALDGTDTYIAGIRKLFEEYKVEGAEEALDAAAKQITDYATWTRTTVLPKAREDTRLPPELYAFGLKQYGTDVDPQLLMQRAQLAFMEIRAQMQQLAPLVAKEKGIDATDYREVIAALKRDTIPNARLEASYREVIDAIDPIIERENIVDVPQREMQMRLGSDAESAAQPAPHFRPAPLVGNTGQQGTFVLPVGNPGGTGDDAAYDDFNFDAVRWTLSAHEGRPGHELQFTAMVERGVSLARSMFAFNSVNVEGWALYAEAELVPYEPLDGQLIALQFRLLRAARAMLDPMLNLGTIDRERAGRVLTEEVMLSPAMARQELDRYTFNAPGQATSYFYGYTRILELRMRTELALGAKFDRRAFNNFLLDQGLLPPDQLAEAVETVFIPAQQRR